MVDASIPEYPCCICGKTKPATEFFKRKGRPRGVDYDCKECAYKKTSARYAKKTGNPKTPESLPGEEWREVSDWPCYSVSNLGRIRRIRTGSGHPCNRLLKQPRADSKVGPRPNEYVNIRLQDKGRALTQGIHQLVAAAFIGPCPDGLIVNHKDGLKWRNRADNLEYTTYSGNTQHARDVLGTLPLGETHHHAILTVERVLKIRADRAAGAAVKDLAAEHGVAPVTIHQVLRGRNWAHVQSPGNGIDCS